MAPATSILAATSVASNKRPAASDAEQLLPVDSSALPQQSDDETAQKKSQQQPKQEKLECPRCRSTNTKFCYYNNYSTAQPRHFCRACRRYWTHGGTLRDVPVGGATRRGNKRRRVDSSAAEPSSSPPHATTATHDACLPDLSTAAAFPFLSDGTYLMPQFDLGFFTPSAFSSWPSSVVPDFYDGLAPWDDGTIGAAAGVTGALGDVAGMELTWPPPGNWLIMGSRF